MTELSLHILDIVQNSISAKADFIQLEVTEDIDDNILTIKITDNGLGMTPNVLEKATDPYFTSRTTRKVGLGLPLFRMAAEQCNGNLTISSEPGKGTCVCAIFEIGHIDRQPMGDLAGTISMLAATNAGIRFLYKHSTSKGSFVFDTNEVNEILEGVSIANPKVMKYLSDMIRENVSDLNSII
jgi:hypothetical protein